MSALKIYRLKQQEFIRLYKTGKFLQKEIAEKIGISRKTISGWKIAYEQGKIKEWTEGEIEARRHQKRVLRDFIMAMIKDISNRPQQDENMAQTIKEIKDLTYIANSIKAL